MTKVGEGGVAFAALALATAALAGRAEAFPSLSSSGGPVGWTWRGEGESASALVAFERVGESGPFCANPPDGFACGGFSDLVAWGGARSLRLLARSAPATATVASGDALAELAVAGFDLVARPREPATPEPDHLADLRPESERDAAAVAFAPPASGASVLVYVAGGRVDDTHAELWSRASALYDDDLDPVERHECRDWLGTHAASLAVGTTYGVARSARIANAVAFPGCVRGGTVSEAVAAMDRVLRHRRRATREADARGDPAPPAVALITHVVSAAGPDPVPADALEAIAARLIASGVVVVAPAGDGDGGDACDVAVARMPGVLTVGASGRDGRPLASSNRGACVDLWAPGEAIAGAVARQPDLERRVDGTLPAAAIAAGAAAVALDAFGGSPERARAALDAAAANGVLRVPDRWRFQAM